MEKKEMYGLLYPADRQLLKFKLDFFVTKEKLEGKMKELQKKKIDTGQDFLEFTRVFPKGSVYNTFSAETFKNSMKEKKGKEKNTLGDMFVCRKLKNGKRVAKHYHSEEEVSFLLSEWKKEGDQEIIVVNEKHSSCANYYFHRDVLNKWRKKEPLFV